MIFDNLRIGNKFVLAVSAERCLKGLGGLDLLIKCGETYAVTPSGNGGVLNISADEKVLKIN